MSDDPVAREAPDEAADARVIDVAEAADASAEALAEALADAPVVQVEDAVGLARLRLLGDEPAPFEADLPEAPHAIDVTLSPSLLDFRTGAQGRGEHDGGRRGQAQGAPYR